VGDVNLQATLSSSSAVCSDSPPMPHHPITCQSQLYLHEDGRLECEHASVAADDARTHHCLDHSIAILLIEVLAIREGRVP
jgi:hypothetical protein